MIFEVPTLDAADNAVLGMIHEQRGQLRYQVNQNPHRWTGFLRRNTFARAVQGSNSIEGYDANLTDAVEIIDDEKPESVEEETQKALVGYRNAMTYILRISDDSYAEIGVQLIRSLHFMMLSYDLTKLPGQWRPGTVYVVREQTGETVYEGPEATLIPEFMDELVAQMTANENEDAVIRGAMAHLNLAMIHPFKDGNGRMARALQTLLLARDGVLSPVFCSIEEWLGRNTQAYYDILSAVGQGSWHPDNNAISWIRFCLVAHYQQAATLIRRSQEFGRLWAEIDRLIKRHSLHDRFELALMNAAVGYRVRNNRYRADNNISDVVASRDLKRLCDLGLLEPVGEKRGRYYVGAAPLRDIWRSVRGSSRAPNPYDLLRQRQPDMDQLPLPGLE